LRSKRCDQDAAAVFDVEQQFRQAKGEAEEVRLSQVQYSMPVASDFAKDTYLVNRIPKRVTRAATKIKRIITKFGVIPQKRESHAESFFRRLFPQAKAVGIQPGTGILF
jgi:hypothetical protein